MSRGRLDKGEHIDATQILDYQRSRTQGDARRARGIQVRQREQPITDHQARAPRGHARRARRRKHRGDRLHPRLATAHGPRGPEHAAQIRHPIERIAPASASGAIRYRKTEVAEGTE